MDVGQWPAVSPPPPPPTAPPTLPPYGYAVAVQPWFAPPAPAPARRTWVGVTAVLLALASVAVSVLAVVMRPAVANPSGLHAVTDISSAPWSAEFVDTSGAPARWDPCTPIHYVVDPDFAPAGATADVTEAFARLHAASGLTFVSDGTTQERPTSGRQAYQPTVYGHAWAPVLISWSPPAGTDLLNEPKAEAVTVPVAVGSAAHTGGGSIVSAEVVLNTARQLPVGFGPGPSEGEVLMHELGHAVGLGHVNNIGDAMYPTVRGLAAYGPGDLEGFAAVGAAAGCHAAPPARTLDVPPLPLG
ncbi:hypothetical protein acdb102_01000 [Acidothermaceae bacterium B102]|nr:hypothetical protein acdb102_01000 [Acidothermaceae bacterium B102]